jgi:Spy/CpxP family protein refolding chaperone
MNCWKMAAAAGVLALSVCGASLAAPGGKPAAKKVSAAPSAEAVNAKRAEALMTQLKMTPDQKKRARAIILETQEKLKKISLGGAPSEIKQQKAKPVMEKLRVTMMKILTPEQQKQLDAMRAAGARQGAPAAPGAPPSAPR